MKRVLLSQLQNSSARKIVLLDYVESAPSRLPFWAGHRRCGPARHCRASQHDPKTSIFRCRGVLQLALFVILLLAAGCYQIHSDDDLRAVPTTNNPNVLPMGGKAGSVPSAGF